MAEGLKFCQSCGKPAPVAGFSLPAGVNLTSLDGVKGFINGLPFHKQRLALMAASVIGALSAFLPWYTARVMGLKITANSFGMKAMGERDSNTIGIISFVVFLVAIGLCFIRDRTKPMGKLKFVMIAPGAINLIIGISQFVVFNGADYAFLRDYGGIGLGLYMLVLISLALCAIPFVKPLEL